MTACDIWTSHYRSRDPDRLDITRAGCDRLLRENKPAPGVILAPSAKLVFPALRAMKAATPKDVSAFGPLFGGEQKERS